MDEAEADKLCEGSSPLTRGKVTLHPLWWVSSRIIPAYAGKSMPVLGRNAVGRDHPRLRGEKVDSLVLPGVRLGSSPLTRGKEDRNIIRRRLLRIIPAYAGKRIFFISCFLYAQDYPRLRGEKTALLTERKPIGGSSPLTRGKGWAY